MQAAARTCSSSSSMRIMRTPIVILAALLGLAQGRPAETFRIYVVDVEGGGATLVVAPSGQSMLIDSGSPGPAAERDSARIKLAMQAAGLAKINFLFTTHYDSDHVGGAPAADAIAHFDRFFDHGEMDPKWEQNRGIEDRYKAYLAIAAGKRRTASPGTRFRWGGWASASFRRRGPWSTGRSTAAAPPIPSARTPRQRIRTRPRTRRPPASWCRTAASRFSTSAISPGTRR